MTDLIRFNRRDGLLIAACVVIAAASSVLAVAWFGKAFPEASIDFAVTRDGSEALARKFVEERALLPPGASLPSHHAASFTWDDTARLFLERSFGQERANARLSTDIRLWRWGHRWFTPLEETETRVFVTPAGAVVAFQEILEEGAPGASLTEAQARELATAFGRDVLGRPDSTWTFVESTSTVKPHRVDWTFTWKRAGDAELDALDASYRASVSIHGDRVGGFDEWVQVPEKWLRDYAALRSRNEAASSIDTVFLCLTLLACGGMFLWQVRRRNVPWKLCLGFAAIAAVLMTASSLNALPQALWGYDTRSSYAAFLTLRILGAGGLGIVLGIAVFLLTAGGEPVYRRELGRHVALGKLFTWRGFRTKTFFRSLLLGLTLTAFFLGYQVVFYRVAAHFGAWAPQEIAWDDAVNTKLPWIGILLMGFMPAVTEEFMSRMFSIPFLGRILRWRWAAIVVAAAIWGFGHASYPNQPFWIRGLEVGIAGIVIGAVMVRWGILATLTWHYTVDALLTGLILLRSENLYFRSTAALAIGWTLVPLAASLVLYVRRGGFEPEDGLLNSDQPAPEVPPQPIEEAAPAAPYRPLGRWPLIATLAVVAVAAGVAFIPRPSLDDVARVSVSRPQAFAVAEVEARRLGLDPAAFQRSAILVTDFDPVDASYLLSETPSMQALVDAYRGRLHGVTWRVRYFRPGDKEELIVRVRADDAAIAGEQHLLDEAAPGADLDEDAAREIAARYLGGAGIDVASGWEAKEAKADKLPKRRDWTFEWEDAQHLRQVVGIAGDRIVKHVTYLKVPEAFSRDRQRLTIGKALLILLRGMLGVGAVLGLALLLVRSFRQGAIPVALAARAGIAAAVAMAALLLATWPMMLNGFDTTKPWPLFLTSTAVIVVIGAIGVGVLAGCANGLIAALEPGRVRPLRGHVMDAILGALAARAVATILEGGREIVDAWWPASALPSGISLPDLSASEPVVWLLAAWAIALLLVPPAVGVAAFAHERWLTKPWLRGALLGAMTLALLPGAARTGPEWIAGAIFAVATVLGFYAVVRWLWRGNALAFVLGAAASGLWRAASLIAQPLPDARLRGVIALAVMLAVLAAIAWRAQAPGRATSSP